MRYRITKCSTNRVIAALRVISLTFKNKKKNIILGIRSDKYHSVDTFNIMATYMNKKAYGTMYLLYVLTYGTF